METDNPTLPLFTETQVMGRHWWWLALVIAALGFFPSLLMPETATFWVRSGPVFIGAAAGSLLWLMRLETRIDAAGIHYRYLPLLNRWRHWPWTEFRQVRPRTYSPLGDFGGWGIRGFPGNLAYNVWGVHGLQLVFQSGDRLLLGTQRPEELAATLQALGRLSG
ncbi:MAG TPA: hypothetical protein VF629_18145 [Hymenobacter sp.]|jgi:hypothetical protein|uniref:hypothetical protein n=1 Tax=Hymenobacter sp. TaxID=1898978 RepID=UPI002ED971A1